MTNWSVYLKLSIRRQLSFFYWRRLALQAKVFTARQHSCKRCISYRILSDRPSDRTSVRHSLALCQNDWR